MTRTFLHDGLHIGNGNFLLAHFIAIVCSLFYIRRLLILWQRDHHIAATVTTWCSPIFEKAALPSDASSRVFPMFLMFPMFGGEPRLFCYHPVFDGASSHVQSCPLWYAVFAERHVQPYPHWALNAPTWSLRVQ